MLWLLLGVALTGVAGYLLAALVIFPAPMLPNERQVARVVGLSEDAARAAIEKQGLTVAIGGRAARPGFERGAVIWQDPPPGVAIPRGTQVTLFLSTGSPRLVVPDLRGYDSEFAQHLLAAVGLHVDGIDTVAVKGVTPGSVGATSPEAGDSILIGHSVFLHLAR